MLLIMENVFGKCIVLPEFVSIALRFDWLYLQVPDSKYQEGVYPTNQYRDLQCTSNNK